MHMYFVFGTSFLSLHAHLQNWELKWWGYGGDFAELGVETTGVAFLRDEYEIRYILGR